MRNKRLWLFAAIPLALAAFFLFSSGKEVPLVATATVDTGVVDSHIRITGTAQGPDDIQIIAQVSGIARAVKVRVGDTVAQDGVLIQIDDDDAQARVRSATAGARMIGEEKALHETTLQSLRAVWKAGGEAEITVTNAESQVRVDQARLDRANAELSTARTLLGQYTIKAPIAASVSAVDVRNGQFLSAGKPLMSLRAQGKLEILAKVDQADAALIHPDLPVQVSLNGAPAVDERILRIDPAIQKESNNNYLAVWISAESPALKVLPNQQIDVNIQTGSHASSLRIPVEAVHNRDGKDYVWHIEDGRLRSQAIETGIFGDHYVEVRSGLSAGQEIVLLEGKTLKEGDSVAANRSGAQP